MVQKKILMKVIDVVYILGVLIVIYQLGLALFMGNVVPYPDVMLPYTYFEIVTGNLAFGAIPMTLASIAFWRVNLFRQSRHKVRNLILVFLPAAICLLCMAFYVALVVYMMIRGITLAFGQGMTMR